MDPYIGKLLDNRYEILELIGSGGMARVYKARCHRLNRLVAIKILRDELASDAEFRRRFHDESQAVAMLSHPNIVAVYDVSRSSEFEYIVMELIDGITLKQYMQKKGNKLNWREALHFITQITKALGHAHSRGIIHRDIKPHNIMVLRDGSVKVADFGIARVSSGGHSTLTQEALGSVHYISPEQARGSHIDARSDLYSAGVVLYEMITGRLPFEGDNAVSVAIQHINSIPLSPRELDSTIPEALEAITMRAMSPNPDDRYPSADFMLADLEEFRKNPNINFDYSTNDPLPTEPDTDRTQVMAPSFSSLPRREKERERERDRYRDDDYDYDERPASSPWPIVAAIAVILAFVAGIFFFLYQIVMNPANPVPEQITVPTLTGKLYENVQDDEKLLNGFTVSISGDPKTNDAEEGTILEQSPAAGEKVDAVGAISVVVSAGPEVIIMPPVENRGWRDVMLELKNMGLMVPAPQYEASNEVEKDNVIRASCPEGFPLSPGDEVLLTVSSGKDEQEVRMPLVEGLTLENALKTLNTYNLEPGDIDKEVYHDTVEAGRVIIQYPEAETMVPEGTKVNLQVSMGPDPSTQQSPNEPEEVNLTFPVQLPATGEIVNVRATLDGEEVYNQDVDTAMEAAVDIPLSGTGTKHLVVYINDSIAKQETIVFTHDDVPASDTGT
ncbi:MAG: Stk1 family PASTA domain-containing Ser/Thr kinase [Oscillospiraceae bacterium]|jgi:serine/threonine protein kinase|nr:Stk1 family PASTA domain-containing Ser/Thr kinase [Oscillospiraceae bacterium]MCI9580144.1 Stk1 family PASTA domain-containing Ser/Thr kinase [Oscillospiraceae bacterium]